MWYVLYAFLFFGCTEAVLQLLPNSTIPAVIAFGDSFLDQGNNNNLNTIFKSNYHPYGKDFPGGVATGRFTNGKNNPDLIAARLGINDIVPAYLDPQLQIEDLLTGVSFASGTSGYDPLTAKLASVISVPDQLEMFKEYIQRLNVLVGEERTEFIVANSIYLVVAGTNDIGLTYFTTGARKLQYDVDSYTDFVVDSATSFLQRLYDLGARRIAVTGAPPIGCLPIYRTLAGGLKRDCVKSYNEAAQLYNTKLSSKLQTYFSNLPQSEIVYVDFYNPLFNIIQNPQNYGIDVMNRGCCGTLLCTILTPTCSDTSKFLFWDPIHLTETGYNLVIDQILGGYIDQKVKKSIQFTA